MSSSPRISVLMTVYNRETMVANAIRSILAQDFTDFEFVIVDDGSTDRTAAVVGAFADPRIRLVSLPVNCGIAMGRNVGLKCVRGDFVATMDSDDIAMPARLRRQYEFFQANPGIDIAGTNIIKVDGDRRTEQKHAPDDGTIKARLLVLEGVAMIDPTTMMRSAFLRRTGLQYPNERTDLDQALWIEATAQGARFAVVEEFLMEYYRHPGNITHELSPDHAGHQQRKTPLRARLVGLFYPSLTHEEALAIARWMEVGRTHTVVDVCAAVTAIRKALLDATSHWGESKDELARILNAHFGRAMRALASAGRQDPAGGTRSTGAHNAPEASAPA